MANACTIDIELHPKQALALQTTATEVLFGGAAGGGKLLPLDTLLPTPHGWVAMGDVRVGTHLFDERGRQCTVTRLFAIEREPELYRLAFDDGSTIDACADHLWLTYDAREMAALTRRQPEWRARRRVARPSRSIPGAKSPAFVASIIARNAAHPPPSLDAPSGTVRTTAEIARTLTVGNSRRCNHAVPVAEAIDTPHADLPLDPYTLGAWLGDGTSTTGGFTGIDPEIWQRIERAGYRVTHAANGKSHRILGIMPILRGLGVVGNKHIPMQYLRASRDQRLELLRGLMDTDGTVSLNSGSAEFCNTNARIVDGVYELICSLGWRCNKREGRARLNGRDCGPKWTMKWMASEPVFHLDRKRRLQRIATRRTTRFRYIKACDRIPSRPGRCIQVDSPSRLFLAGDQMVPTHNSFLMRSAAILWCAAIPGLQVYVFRRLFPDLIKNHMEGPKGFRALLAPWEQAGFVKVVEEELRFWNGSRIYLCHCKDDNDRYKYQGAEIHVLLIDELTHFSEVVYRFLRGRVRMVGMLNIPDQYRGLFPRILCGSNPGNIGHGWVKSTFIDAAIPLSVYKAPDLEGGMLRQFIPARLDDNPSMTSEDPLYRARLRGLGNEALVRAMEDGDWDVVAGAFFECFDRERHVIEPFEIPVHWMRFGAFDWGSARPFSYGMFAVSDGKRLKDGRYYPPGALIRYREWYGASAPNVGLKLTAEQVAEGIIAREGGDRLSFRVADPACWKWDGGPSIAERMGNLGVSFTEADNSRIAGWDQVRDRLIGDEQPMVYFFSTCRDMIRCLPAAQHDERRPEDIDTNGEDHCLDELRYACMARPWIREAPERYAAKRPPRRKISYMAA